MIGILVLFTQSNAVICSSGTSRGVRNPVAQLLDSGNLVVRDEDDLIPENFLWQSFDHPDSTFLLGMKTGLVTKGLYVCFSSWKSINDPCQGNFTFEVDINGLQMYLKQNSVAKAQSGDGIEFGLAYLRAFDLWEVVETGRDPPTLRVDPTVAQIKHHSKECAKKYKALSCLHQVVSNVIFVRIIACETTKEAWDKLKEKFHGSDK
ncbi:hypothetical protein GH714_008818 [Hevea brasiliensis]|uniref:Bulb-type lectin domain-containing protein n=1 Tax=Hevea brasiliensis TaxID=3981 RepID=A0A6A6KAJ9_HEVBR|nr:hypothetical protein GH714_008818 [Hevea brasiliensis]